MYKTEKRYAEVGERIVIIQPFGAEGENYVAGAILTVTQTEGVFLEARLAPGEVAVEGTEVFIYPEEYEVIVGEETEE